MGSIVLPPAITVREGTTDRLVMQLFADDDPIDLTDIDHIEIELRDTRRNTYHYASNATPVYSGVSDAVNGMVYLDPPSTLFKAVCSPYLGYVRIIADDGTWYSVPEEVEFFIQVRKNY